MRDMIPPQDRSIRNIPVTPNARRAAAPARSEPPPPRTRRPRRPSLWPWIILVVVICAAAGTLLSTVFEGTTVTLHPHTAAVTPSAPLTAVPNAGAGSLAYQTVSITRSATTTVTASGTQHVSTPASGVVTIYNAYSTAPQKLIANTRLAAPDGKLYRIHGAVTVPGGVKNTDGSITPGTTSATIYADQPGPSYNRTDPTQFTIPGFQGDPRFTTFYAKSTVPISGGFVGDQAAIAKADLTAAQQTLKQSLDSIIAATVSNNIPDGFIVIPGTLQVSYSDIAQTPNQDSSVTLTQSATGLAAILRGTDLATAVAQGGVTGYGGQPVAFSNPGSVLVSLVRQTGSSTPLTGPLHIQLAGPVTLVWQFDPQAIQTALVGKPKSSFQDIIKTFEPAVEKAEAKVRPFWKSTFPTDPTKIKIVVAAS